MANRRLKEKEHDGRLFKVLLITLAGLLGTTVVPLVFIL